MLHFVNTGMLFLKISNDSKLFIFVFSLLQTSCQSVSNTQIKNLVLITSKFRFMKLLVALEDRNIQVGFVKSKTFIDYLIISFKFCKVPYW